MVYGKNLILPFEVGKMAQEKEEENYRFLTFLKCHGDPKELDRRFKELHNKIFPLYDCKQCRNCCKSLCAQIPKEDIDKDAAFLNMSREEFIDRYLKQDESGEWLEKHSPCGFLSEADECILGECCPKSCKDFPYTDQPDRISHLYSILDAVAVCPAAYEIYEALKKQYHFRPYR